MMARILCIEDEAALLQDLAEELREAGYDVIEASSGEAGLRAIADANPDLVLCDITMPGMSGLDVLKHVRVNSSPLYAEIPFVFLTALADRENIVDGKLRGADDYLTKPIDFDILIATVKSRLNQIERLRTENESKFAEKYTCLLDAMKQKAEHQVQNAINVFDHLKIAAIIVSSNRQIVQLNAYAGAIVDSKSGLVVENRIIIGPGCLRVMLDSVFTSIAREEVFPPGILELPRAAERSSLVASIFAWKSLVHAKSSGPSAAILIVDPEERTVPPVRLLNELYGLTRAETKVAIGLMKGLDLQDIAAAHGIAEATARSQLKSIFSKTDTHRQGELVSLLARICVVSEDTKVS